MTTLVARDTFAGPASRIVSKGDLVDSTDPIVKGREELFETVEQAAARPSEVIHTAAQVPAEPDETVRARRTRK